MHAMRTRCDVGCGHLWQARFYSCPMEKTYCWQALSYIEQNPVRAGVAIRPAEYPYSSARAHVGEIYPEDVDTSGYLLTREWRASYTPEEWAGVLEANVSDEAMARRLKEATAKGIPFGSSAFTRRLEESVGRDLSTRGPGRPKRLASTTTGE
jgi:putative transposase